MLVFATMGRCESYTEHIPSRIGIMEFALNFAVGPTIMVEPLFDSLHAIGAID